MTRALWPHQTAAVDAAVAELHGSHRTHVIAACGTGKTTIGAEVSTRTAPNEPVLVVVPTLDLLAQTVAEHVEHLGPRTGACYGVYWEKSTSTPSEDTERRLAAQCEDVSTDPEAIARWLHSGGRITVFSTYQSLAAIIAAHQAHNAPPWGLIVVDEAHRSVGQSDRAWVAVHKNDLIPARRRLYMTATPRIMNDHGDDAISMDNVEIFGREAYKLGFGTAIDSGLLADYRVVVSVITDRDVQALLAKSGSVLTVDGHNAPAQMIAAHVALLKAAREYGLERVITYHHRVVNAGRFAQLLPAVAALMAEGERPADAKAYMVHGGMAPVARRAILDELTRARDGSMVAVSNARVLAEGVDVPELDGVMFTDPRESPVDIVQAVGRALRRGRRANKTATIVIPLMLGDTDLDSLEAVGGSAFDTVAHTLQAMRAHDERLAAWLDQRRTGLGATDPTVIADEKANRLPEWLCVEGVELPEEFADRVVIRAIETSSSAWWVTYGRAVQYYATHGDLEPSRLTDPALAGWLGHSRDRHRKGRLEPERVEALAALGMVWEPMEVRWAETVAALKRFREQDGDAHIDRWVVMDDGFPLGQRIIWIRSHPENVPEWVKDQLDALGMVWDLQEQRWQILLDRLEEYGKQYGDVKVRFEYVCPEGDYPLGKRLRYLQRVKNELPDWVRERAEALGVAWPRPKGGAWERFVGLCEEYLATKEAEGVPRPVLADVPSEYVTEDGYRLGEKISFYRMLEAGVLTNPKTGKPRSIDPEHRQKLDAMGMRWRTTPWVKKRSLTAEEADRLRTQNAEVDGTRRTWPKQRELTAAVVELVDDGVPIAEVAELLGVATPTLKARVLSMRAVLNGTSAPVKSRKRKLTAEEVDRLRALHAEDDGTRRTQHKQRELTAAAIELAADGVAFTEVAEVLGLKLPALNSRIRLARKRAADSAKTPEDGAPITQPATAPAAEDTAPATAVEPPAPAVTTCYYCSATATSELDTGAQLLPLCADHRQQLSALPGPRDEPAPVIVDGSNIAWVNRNGGTASYRQLEAAVAAIRRKFEGHEVHVVIDPALPYQVEDAEQDTVREAVQQGACVQVPAGTVGGGDAVLLEWADRTGGIVLSNDAFRPFQERYPWLCDGRQRLFGAVLLGNEWIFQERVPPAPRDTPRRPPGT